MRFFSSWFPHRLAIQFSLLLFRMSSLAFGQNESLRRPQKPENERVLEILKSEVDPATSPPLEFNYQGETIAEVIDDLEFRFDISIVLDPNAKDGDLPEDQEINFSITDVEVDLGVALRLILDEYETTYIVRDGTLRIILKEDAILPENFECAVFDLRPLNKKILRQYDLTQDELNDQYADLIMNVVLPDSWDDSPGDDPFHFFNGLVVVSQTREILEEIEDLLLVLNQSYDSPVPTSAAK